MKRSTLAALSVILSLLAVGTAAAETVNVVWTAFPSVGGTTIDLQVGDTIEWDVQLGHDLSEIPDQALFDLCDFTGSTLISIGPAITQTTFPTPGVHYFACSVGLGFHCGAFDMNVTVVVSEAVPTPTPTATATATPTPTPAPTANQPTIGTHGLVALVGLMALAGGYALRRRVRRSA